MQVHNEILRAIARNCESYGIKEEAVYQLAGVNPDSIAIPDGMQDWKQGIRMWESALTLTNYQFIGISFGKNITFSVLGWIAPLTSSSPSLKFAWKSFADFFPLMGNMFEYQVTELPDGNIKVLYKPAPAWVETSPLTAAMAAEHAMSLTISLSGYLIGRIIKPVYASFSHPVEAKNQSIFTDLFGLTLFGQKENMLVFDAVTAASPLISANELMYANMQKLCTEKLMQLKSQTSFASKVLQILSSKQAYYNPKLEEVAAMLNISARTLQRKLKEENHTYQSLLEEHQIEMALQLLSRPHMQVQEVAFMLGFTSLQNFSRAFKRKTGFSPTQVKHSQQPVLS
ncbi:AraC family transcriptional regulator ligand-binding domain-containing protein [Rhodocytophaga aerolata]|uniref:AraC family transcriptional regulator ligand-binding domain-containing protein n=1 Tax=Rhodocytophaga aerolata TaxID=455078 RepID=A0ABT8REG8_9BACT|nr:AraC family transcriptional regulator [Rhodocytophaga aerolata]MDO1450511.1 AraC family transcriptional regulator ligand-binding domain-containing protein [Rhodocytophaga aerolata]